MRILNTLLSAVFLYNQAARAEIVPLDLILDADSEEVHYVRGASIAMTHQRANSMLVL